MRDGPRHRYRDSNPGFRTESPCCLRQNPHPVAAYADVYLLDLQRAHSIVGDIGGSNQARYNEINRAGILPDGDAKQCPAVHSRSRQRQPAMA